MSRKSSQVRDKQIQKISELLDQWKSDQEIMKELKIPKMTYYRYKSRILKQDKSLLDKTRTNELEYRLSQVKHSLEYCISINKSICEHSKDDKSRIEASRMIVQANMGLLNLAQQTPYDNQVKVLTKDVTNSTNALTNKDKKINGLS